MLAVYFQEKTWLVRPSVYNVWMLPDHIVDVFIGRIASSLSFRTERIHPRDTHDHFDPRSSGRLPCPWMYNGRKCHSFSYEPQGMAHCQQLSGYNMTSFSLIFPVLVCSVSKHDCEVRFLLLSSLISLYLYWAENEIRRWNRVQKIDVPTEKMPFLKNRPLLAKN